ncbi:MAG: 4-hydroxy-tetrahydrodipicolinate synthase [Proteobacteria bacterium]|nr:4-hydroxy-tetrahydrodipicolinate synthase [Pseudomonadota bacterium]
MSLTGVYLPIVTPFIGDKVDIPSYESLLTGYLEKGIAGVIPLGTTGESPVLSEYEVDKIVDKTIEVVDKKVPIYLGVGGNHTKKVIRTLRKLESLSINGVLSVCPYYNRPGQDGLFQHFRQIADNTNLEIIIYNIPYRTGVNLNNETLFRLAEFKNIVGVKDSCGDLQQSLELLREKPDKFSVMTGEDHQFYLTLVHGGDGGILASAHLNTEEYIAIDKLIRANNHQEALSKWQAIASLIPLLFKESNPAPLKYCLSKMGLITSSEVALPLTPISEGLKLQLDQKLGF